MKSPEMEFSCQDHKPRTMATPLCAMQTASQVVNAPALFSLESTGDWGEGEIGREDGRGGGGKECVRAALLPRILEHRP